MFYLLIPTTAGITCVLIDVVFLASRNDRHIAATLSSTFDLTYMSMTYVRGTIVPYISFNNSQHMNLSFTTPYSVRELFKTGTAILNPLSPSSHLMHSLTYSLKNCKQ
jgi:hypothetical protein